MHELRTFPFRFRDMCLSPITPSTFLHHLPQLILSCGFLSPCCHPRKPLHPDIQSCLIGSVSSHPVLCQDLFSAAQPKAPPSSLDLLSVHVCQRFPSNLPTALEGLPHCSLLLPGRRRIATCGERPLYSLSC